MDATTYKETVTDAFNRAADLYDQMGVDFFTPMGARLVERVAPRPGERVLDVGCGLGACMFPAAEMVGCDGSVLGIDIAEAMVSHAVATAAKRGITTVHARVMDGEYPDLPKFSFDVVVGSYSLIFLPDAPAALSRYAALLADGGRLGFTSPVFTDDTFPFLPPVFTELIPRSLLEGLPPQWQPAALAGRFNRWLSDPEQLAATLTGAGFTAVSIEDEVVTMVADSGTAWVDWSHTQGMRLLWEHLSVSAAARLRERLITALDAMRDGSGSLRIDTPVRYVTASVER